MGIFDAPILKGAHKPEADLYAQMMADLRHAEAETELKAHRALMRHLAAGMVSPTFKLEREIAKLQGQVIRLVKENHELTQVVTAVRNAVARDREEVAIWESAR